MRSLLFIAFFFLVHVLAHSQESSPDTTAKVVVKQGISGSIYTVPEDKQWEFISLTVSEGSYPILVGSVKYDSILQPGDSVAIPFWVAEAELLSGNSTNLTYTLKVKESTYQE